MDMVDIVTVVLSLMIVILIIAIVFTLYRYITGGPRHIEEYFEANFKTLITEFDLVTVPKLRHWKSGMMKRLKGLGGYIGLIEASRVKIDKRLSGLDKTLTKLDGK